LSTDRLNKRIVGARTDDGRMAVDADDVRRVALSLPRAYEALVRDQVKFRVGQLVFAALSRDERTLGVGFPREQRAAAVAGEPDKFALPSKGDLRYRWIHVRMDAIDAEELRELVVDGWAMCVPARVARDYAESGPDR
jgi:hypothetical protein